jgi:hypothetical protein
MKPKTIFFQLLAVAILTSTMLFSCTKDEEEDCYYQQSTATANCGANQFPVFSTGCCPAGTPFYCSVTNSCYAFCSAAVSDCGSTTVIRANTGGGSGGTNTGGGSNTGGGTNTGGGGSNTGACQYSITGTWVRQSTANGCQGLRVNMSGTSGGVTSSPSGCCFSVGDPIWSSFRSSDCTIEVRILDADNCSFIRYDRRTISFNNANSVNIGSITYTRN